MVEIDFEGFFQCRLATDSDRYDEKRGRDGWTFAFGAEPDLDRIIRFHNPVALRSHSPVVGVFVTRVNGSPVDHPLIGAKVYLSEQAVFEGRNNVVASAGFEPIHPMKLGITQAPFILERQSDYNPLSPVQSASFRGRGVEALPDPLVRGVSLTSPVDAINFRKTRANQISSDLAGNVTAAERVILQHRLARLKSQNDGAVIQTLISAVSYGHELRNAATIVDPANWIGGQVDTVRPWSVRYWMGCWDADTLTGYVRGFLELPLT